MFLRLVNINKLNEEERPSIFLSFFFSFLFLFNIFLIHLMFWKKFTDCIVGEKISPRRSDGNKQFFFLWLNKEIYLEKQRNHRPNLVCYTLIVFLLYSMLKEIDQVQIFKHWLNRILVSWFSERDAVHSSIL